MTCTTLAGAPLQEVLWCAIEQGAGGYAMAAILMFMLLLYAMYKFKLPIEAQVPIGIAILYIFAGAGAMEEAVKLNENAGASPFTLLMWIVVILIGTVVFFAFWRLRKS